MAGVQGEKAETSRGTDLYERSAWEVVASPSANPRRMSVTTSVRDGSVLRCGRKRASGLEVAGRAGLHGGLSCADSD